MMRFLFWVMPVLLFSQETETIKKTLIYTAPHAARDNALGQLYPGATITKLKKDKSGQFVKAYLEFYIPIEFLEEGRVSHPPGIQKTGIESCYPYRSQIRIPQKTLIFHPWLSSKLLAKEKTKVN